MSIKIAYIDEFGNNSFDFEKQGSHFIVAAVICDSTKVKALEESVDEIRKKHNFQEGEIKSSKVSKNHQRRIKILKDISTLDCAVYAVIIDKRELKGQGFKYKKSFYKYLNNLLYKELFRTYPKLELYVDEHGANDYMLEFKKYVRNHHDKNLFSGSEFDVKNSKNEKLIQLADFIAGTLGYIFDEKKECEYSSTFRTIIEPIVSNLNFFPKKNTFKEIKESNIDSEFDPLVAEASLHRINNFLEKTVGDTQQKEDQINFLKLLLLFQRVYYRSSYVLTDELFKHLNQSRDTDLKKEYFRTKVVGNLRDQGIMISSSRSGYKIPTTTKDLESFINHGNKIILPMLNRINEARSTIRLVSTNELDILDNFSELKGIVDFMNNKHKA
ncbi:DUF3800 domain-containing protein [Draconibacterium sediminis]|uniref:DUF3800 domain-containing protein n=1 Tax=Draconibacterium sediminis TaxID=1544798 RepID=UPI0026F0547C|nr:DUF3800 domain-containing protein [Draconibacterium sediminis]